MKFDYHSFIQLLPILAVILVAIMNSKKYSGEAACNIKERPSLEKLDYVTHPQQFNEDYPTLLECFATWCNPCREQIPHIAELAQKYHNINIVSVTEENKEKVENFIISQPEMKSYNVAIDSDKGIERYMDMQGVRGIPHCFLYSKEGLLAWNGHPMNVEKQIQELLK